MARMSNMVGGAARYMADNRGNVPIMRALLGVLLVGFFLIGLMLQVQTSESFLLNGSPVTLAANWGVLMQPILLVQGKLPIDEAKSVMWGWGIELVYLVCVVGEVTMHGRLGGWFKTGAWVLVGFNFYTDLQYGNLASGFWGQFAFAVITSFVVAFFGVVGLNMIWSAISDR